MTTTTSARGVFVEEPTAWLRGTAGGQLRRARRMGLDLDDPAGPVILAPLAGRMSVPGSLEDRTCDRCGRYCPAGECFHALLFRAAPRLLLVGGLCCAHARAEGVGG